jgi:hypothetical protein
MWWFPWTLVSTKDLDRTHEIAQLHAIKVHLLRLLAWEAVKAFDNYRRRLMAKVQDILTELANANASTNEIASDLDEVLAKLAGAGGDQAQIDAAVLEAQGLSARLRGVAAKYTADPVVPVDPPV